MFKYIYLLNKNSNEVFYEGIFGFNLPNINKLIELGYYSKLSKNNNLKLGTIGLNITQVQILKDAIDKNYENILLLEDDIYFNYNYFLTLQYIFNKYYDYDIIHIGSSVKKNFNYNKNFIKIDNINSYSIFVPNTKLCEKIEQGGLFAVFLSKKAINIFYDEIKILNMIIVQ